MALNEAVGALAQLALARVRALHPDCVLDLVAIDGDAGRLTLHMNGRAVDFTIAVLEILDEAIVDGLDRTVDRLADQLNRGVTTRPLVLTDFSPVAIDDAA